MDTSTNGRVERLNLAFNYLKRNGIAHSVTHLAQLMGRTRSTVSNALNGVAACVNEKFLSEFCGCFKVISPDWLLTGEGEMFAQPERPATVAVSVELLERLYDELHALRQEVANLHHRLDDMGAKPAPPRRYSLDETPLSIAAEP